MSEESPFFAESWADPLGDAEDGSALDVLSAGQLGESDPLGLDQLDTYLDTYASDSSQFVDEWEVSGFGFDLPA